MYNKAFVVHFCFAVYYFCFAEKMDNFHFGLVKLVGNQFDDGCWKFCLCENKWFFVFVRGGLVDCNLFT